jgi:hypothetical protein
MTFPGFRLGFHGVDENRNHDGPAIDAIKLTCFPHNTILDLGDFIATQFEAGGTHNAVLNRRRSHKAVNFLWRPFGSRARSTHLPSGYSGPAKWLST